MYFAALFLPFLLTIALCDLSTFNERYLPGHVLVTIFNKDWLGCLQACNNEPRCISYNYFKENKTCEINSNGIKDQCESKWTVYSRGWIFHQIRPTPGPKPELGDDASNPAGSCEEIFSTRRHRNVSSGTYYIKVTSYRTIPVYCQMAKTVECGEGGWTLAMKIDGHKTTFRYDSSLWTTRHSYNENQGKDLTKSETKLDVFNSITLKEGFCVGMQVNGDTKWLKIIWQGVTPTSVFSDSRLIRHSIGPSKWKSLLTGSYLQGTKEGYNVHSDCRNGPRARIGIVSQQIDCNQTVVSRIGFGTAGDAGGMDTNNTCGNEAVDAHGNGTSIKAFCYIFIK